MSNQQQQACPLCGHHFNANSEACHTSCPMSGGCHLICCPHCGYQIPDENQMAFTAKLKRLWTQHKQQERDTSL